MLNQIRSRFVKNETSTSARVSPEAGFTLLEIIIVLGIVGTLMAVLIGGLGSGQVSAKKKETAVKVNNIQASLLKYQADVGRFPSAAEGLDALLTNPGVGAKWSGPYIGAEDDIKDGWQQKFSYELTPKGAKLISSGPDSQQGTEDDISYVNGREEAAAAEKSADGQAPAN